MKFITLTFILLLQCIISYGQDTVVIRSKDSTLKKKIITIYYNDKKTIKSKVETRWYPRINDPSQTVITVTSDFNEKGELTSVKTVKAVRGWDFSLIRSCKEVYYLNGKREKTVDCLHNKKQG